MVCITQNAFISESGLGTTPGPYSFRIIPNRSLALRDRIEHDNENDDENENEDENVYFSHKGRKDIFRGTVLADER